MKRLGGPAPSSPPGDRHLDFPVHEAEKKEKLSERL
ncbi:MAG: hypothetical protein ACI9W4_002059, partial [Rhodothermales bacterium]